MFDIGFWEMCLIGIVALLVVGPERLPDVARTVGRWVGKAQRLVANAKSDFNRELESGELRELIGEQRKQIEQLKSVVDETRSDIETSSRDVVESAEQSWTETLTADASETESDTEQTESNSILPPDADGTAAENSTVDDDSEKRQSA